MEPFAKDFNIVVSSDYYDQFLDTLVELGHPSWKWRRVNYPGREQDFYNQLADVDVLITREDLTEAEFDRATRLKLLQVPTAGYDHINLKRAQTRGVPVGANGGANAIAVAEHVIMMALCIYRNLLFHHNAVVNGPWVNLKYSNLEIAGKVMGIVGMGNVGRQLAIRARAMGMRVLYYDIERADPVFETTHQVTFAPFAQVLATSDVVSYHVPLTRKTHRLINAETIAAMKDQAVLINTSRGAVQDEDAIAAALASGKLKGAGLDVFNEGAAEQRFSPAAVKQYCADPAQRTKPGNAGAGAFKHGHKHLSGLAKNAPCIRSP